MIRFVITIEPVKLFAITIKVLPLGFSLVGFSLVVYKLASISVLFPKLVSIPVLLPGIVLIVQFFGNKPLLQLSVSQNQMFILDKMKCEYKIKSLSISLGKILQIYFYVHTYISSKQLYKMRS